MDYELSDAHRLIRDTARRVAREKVAPRAAELDETGEYPQDIFAAHRDVGLLGLSIPPEYGGSGAGFLALALAVEEIAKYCNSSALILLLSALSTQPINLGGSEEQKRQWLPPAAAPVVGGVRCGRQHAPCLSIARTFATEMCIRVSSDAIQILGAQGYMKDHPLERHYRDARQLTIVEGTSPIQRLGLAPAPGPGAVPSS